MLIRPIPRALLCHSVTLLRLDGADEWGNAKYTESVIDRVRLELDPGHTADYDKDRIKESLQAKLYIDGKNPALELGIKPDDLVIWKGREFRVKGVKTYFGQNPERPHHLEVGLV